jgi:hypothetical protein
MINNIHDLNNLAICPLCGFPFRSESRWDSYRDILYVYCDYCGQYDITSEMILFVSSDLNILKNQLSSIVRRHYIFTGNKELLTLENYKLIASQAPDKNDVSQKVRYLIGYIAYKSQFPGDKIELKGDQDYPICFAENAREFKFYIQYAKEAGYVNEEFVNQRTGYQYWLTPKGWEETRHIPTLESPYVFVAMSFSKENQFSKILTQAYDEAIKPAIEEDAGYQKAVRVDREQFLGDIVFEIIARIKECRFLVADVTEQKNGVYYEAGYAMGMGLPVIWLCHKDDMKNAHFDTRQMNHIPWDDIPELRKNLANRILATIGKGPIK